MSHAIQKHVESNGFSVVRSFIGHGVGAQLHEEPEVPNFGAPGRGPRLIPGMTLAIEPMVNAGTHEVSILGDGWTTVTKDGRLSAHFEHTIAITPDGPVIMTDPDGKLR
jgi:methionyl aminopeptidase